MVQVFQQQLQNPVAGLCLTFTGAILHATLSKEIPFVYHKTPTFESCYYFGKI